MERKRFVLSVVLAKAEMEELDSLAAAEGRSRSNAARWYLRDGMRIARRAAEAGAARKAGAQ